MERIINIIRNNLNKPLPGLKAHAALAPEGRQDYVPDTQKTDAGVLILIFPDPENIPSIVLIKRATYNGYHSDQIGFPGGKSEVSDKAHVDTALRECEEEIGINSNSVQILGKLTNLYIPVSNFMVYPYVGYTTIVPKFNIDENEVKYLIIFPLEKLTKLDVMYTSVEYNHKHYKIPYFNINGEKVWGATSMILNELKEIISI